VTKPTILLVDDEKKLLDLISFRLQHLGYRVITASSGRDALEAVKGDRPDLIILDIAMPGMDGLTACGHLRKSPGLATTPILMLTARSGVDDVNRAMATGADDYIVKPYDPAVLEMKLRRYLGGKHANTSEGKARA
jgi:DNA-binding response OmpR family regulator